MWRIRRITNGRGGAIDFPGDEVVREYWTEALSADHLAGGRNPTDLAVFLHDQY